MFGVDPDPDIDLRSFFPLSLSLTDRHFTRHVVTRQGAILQRPYKLRHFTRYMITHHSATLHRLWRSLRWLSALVIYSFMLRLCGRWCYTVTFTQRSSHSYLRRILHFCLRTRRPTSHNLRRKKLSIKNDETIKIPLAKKLDRSKY